MPDRKPDNYGYFYWHNFFLQGRLPIKIEGEEKSLTNNPEPIIPSKFSQLMSQLDILKFNWKGKYQTNDGIEILQDSARTEELEELSDEAKEFILKGDRKEDISMRFIYKGGIRRAISLESDGRRLEFVFDIESAGSRIIENVLEGGEWRSLNDTKLEDLRDPMLIAERGIKRAKLVGRSGSS